MDNDQKIVIAFFITLFAAGLAIFGHKIYRIKVESSQLDISRQIACDTITSAETLGIALHIDINDNWFDLVEHDAWGLALRGKQESGKVWVQSAGPDHIWGSVDDIKYESRMDAAGLDAASQSGYNLK